jgi:RNA polymerase sigma-70 factor, ECF subfamily
MDSDLKKRSDKELVEAFKAGNKEVFDELVSRHTQTLYYIAYGLLNNPQDAEEVVQDTFVRAYKALDKFRGDSSFKTWINRIVMNLSRNKYHWNRRRGSEVNLSLYQPGNKLGEDDEREIQLPDNKMKPDNLIEAAELEQTVLLGFENLPKKLKEAMVLRHVNDMPYEKIAEALDCKVGTVKSRLSRGRELLKEFLASRFSDNPILNRT